MIYNEDCLEGMKRLEDNSVDMILTDLPYGITDCDIDKRIPFEPMWAQFKRVTKLNAAIVLFSQMPFGAELIMSNRKMFRYEWIYQKACASGFLNSKKMPLKAHENILVFYRQLPTYNPQFWNNGRAYVAKRLAVNASSNWGKAKDCTTINEDGRRYPIDIVKFTNPVTGNRENDSTTAHPQQKPTDLLEYLIKTYTDEGETVLDATMGSGSTGVACANTNRNFIGFELEEKFFNISQKRIEEALAKKAQELF